MQIKEKKLKRRTIEEFADLYGLTMKVNERKRPEGDSSRYYASFDGCEIKGAGVLISTHGNGATQKEAISDYSRKISLQTLVFGASTPNRYEIDVWRLI